MTPQEAEKVINEYGGALAKGTDGVARRLSVLPCSIGRIKMAYFIYVEEVIRRKLLDDEMVKNLLGSYQAIVQFITDEEADIINAISAKIKQGNPITEKEKAAYSLYMGHLSSNVMAELNSFIGEFYGNRDYGEVYLSIKEALK